MHGLLLLQLLLLLLLVLLVLLVSSLLLWLGLLFLVSSLKQSAVDALTRGKQFKPEPCEPTSKQALLTCGHLFGDGHASNAMRRGQQTGLAHSLTDVQLLKLKNNKRQCNCSPNARFPFLHAVLHVTAIEILCKWAISNYF